MLAARAGWPAACARAEQLAGRKWTELRAKGDRERLASRTCEFYADPTGAVLERMVRGAFAWWSANLPTSSTSTARTLLEPARVFAPGNREKFYDAGAQEREMATSNAPLTAERRRALQAQAAELKRPL